MQTEVKKRKGYAMVYHVFEPGVDFDPSDDIVALKRLAEYTLQDGYRIWRVGASYAKTVKPSFYYMVSQDRVGAMNKFISLMPWLSVITSIDLLGEEETEYIRTNPEKFILH